MKRQPLNPFAQTLHDSVDYISTPLRGPKPTRLLIAILALGLPLMQTVPALAGEQVLEIPQSVAIPAASDLLAPAAARERTVAAPRGSPLFSRTPALAALS